jgi:GNAT superfamily N-acetyltransferase
MTADVTAPAITVRPATAADVAALVPMVNDAYRASEGDVFPGSERVGRTDALRKLDGTLVAVAGAMVVGCVRVEVAAPAAHFGLLATHVAMQGRGVAPLLVDHVERMARDAGCGVMHIEVVKEGGRVPFYERRGYAVIRETPGQQWNSGQDWGAVVPWHMVDMEKVLR